jgi:hypothetical protein
MFMYSTGIDVIQVQHEGLSKARMACVNANKQSRIVSLLWGFKSVLE